MNTPDEGLFQVCMTNPKSIKRSTRIKPDRAEHRQTDSCQIISRFPLLGVQRTRQRKTLTPHPTGVARPSPLSTRLHNFCSILSAHSKCSISRYTCPLIPDPKCSSIDLGRNESLKSLDRLIENPLCNMWRLIHAHKDSLLHFIAINRR